MILAKNQKIFNFLVDMVPYLVTERKGFQIVVCTTVCEPLAKIDRAAIQKEKRKRPQQV